MPIVVLAPLLYVCLSKHNNNKDKDSNSNSKVQSTSVSCNGTNTDKTSTQTQNDNEKEFSNQRTTTNNSQSKNTNNTSTMDDSMSDEPMIAEAMMQPREARRMSTFLNNMETIGEACTHPVERLSQFGRNLHTIRHSLLDRGSSCVISLSPVKDNGRNGRTKKFSRSNSIDSHNSSHNDNTESTAQSSEQDCCDSYECDHDDCYDGGYFEEPDILAVTCHGDEVIRRGTAATHFKEDDSSELSEDDDHHHHHHRHSSTFLGARYETFVSNMDTIAEAIREHGTVTVRLHPEDDEEEDEDDVALTESVHLTL